MQFPISDG